LKNAIEQESVANRPQRRSANGRNVGGAISCQATGDLLNAAESELVLDLLIDGNITLDSGAGRKSCGVALALDSNGPRARIGGRS